MSLLKSFLKNCDDLDSHTETIAYLANLDNLMKKNPLIGRSVIKELEDQRNSLKMIASENYSSLAVQLAMGNLLTDKYAEGHPHHRFYAGCENVDAVEEEAVSLAKKLFSSEHAFVQPHSGTDANLIAFWGILIKRIEKPGIAALGKKTINQLSEEEYQQLRENFSRQKLLGMKLEHGGHLTHGSRVNLSSKMLHAIGYGLNPKTDLIDYKMIEEIAMREKPAILLAGYSAYPRLIDFSILKEIADKVGATFVVDMAHFAGLVAGGAFTGNYNPVPFADVVTSTTHKTLRGPRGGLILCKEEYKEFMDKGCPYAMGGPIENIIAAKAIAFTEALTPDFKQYAAQVIKNAFAFAERLKSLGAKLITDGTDNHLVLVDVQKSFGLTGKQAEDACSEINLTLNRNTVPNDPNGPWYCAGIRLGTAALTSRGLKEQEMEKIADILYDLLKVVKPAKDPKTGEASKAKIEVEKKFLEKKQMEIMEMLRHFPLYPEIQT